MEEIVVWYYDVEMAIDAELSEEEMEEARKAGELLAPVEVSCIKEVINWIAEHNRGSVAHPPSPGPAWCL